MEVSKITFTMSKPKGWRPCEIKKYDVPDLVHTWHAALRKRDLHSGSIKEQENQSCNAKRKRQESRREKSESSDVQSLGQMKS